MIGSIVALSSHYFARLIRAASGCQLDHLIAGQRLGRQPRLRAPAAGVLLVVGGVPRHLSHRAAGAPQREADVLAPHARLPLLDAVLVSDPFPRPGQGDDREHNEAHGEGTARGIDDGEPGLHFQGGVPGFLVRDLLPGQGRLDKRQNAYDYVRRDGDPKPCYAGGRPTARRLGPARP